MKNYVALILLTIFTMSLNGQLTINWTDPIDVAPSSYKNDYPRIVLDNNNLPLITWGGNLNVYFSKWAGNGFADPVKLNNDTTTAYVATWTGPDLASRNDTIYVGFMHSNWGQKTYLVRSFDNGETFNAPVLIENYPDSTSRFPTIAIDQSGHPLVAVMKMTLNGHDPHYVIRKSFDHGASFTAESNAGGWSGTESEACDCCPATLKANENKVCLFYRDNLNNIRDTWATVSTDYGATFSQGFNVDEHQWQIFGCPSSGPDGVIIGDTIYTVFMSDGLCYLSKANVNTGMLASVTPLGEMPVTGSQNFPRIDNYNNSVVVSWRVSSGSTKLFLSYTDDITNGQPLLQDTVYLNSLSSADLALGEDGIHIAIEDLDDGTVKYIYGTFSVTPVDELANAEFSIYPNPVQSNLHIEGFELFESYTIYSINGQELDSGQVRDILDLSGLAEGSYILELTGATNRAVRQFIIK